MNKLLSNLAAYGRGAVKNAKEGKISSIFGALGALFAGLQFVFDGVPETEADWATIIPLIVVAIQGLISKGPEKIEIFDDKKE